MKRILYLEDDNKLAGIVVEYLSHFYNVKHISNLESIESLLTENHYDVAILDRNINGLDIGLTAIDLIHKYDEKTSIIITSSYSSVDDKIEGLELGADDYLEKPFNIRELQTRIAVLLRRRLPSTTNAEGIKPDNINHQIHDSKKMTLVDSKREWSTIISFKNKRMYD